MPPKKTKKALKSKKGKGKTTRMPQVQTTWVNVRVAGGPGGPGGGGGASGGSGGGAYLSVPQGYGTTYAPPPMGYGPPYPPSSTGYGPQNPPAPSPPPDLPLREPKPEVPLREPKPEPRGYGTHVPQTPYMASTSESHCHFIPHALKSSRPGLPPRNTIAL
jgi:hypothetical protein